MSTKKGSSIMPNGGYTLTSGSNYMLDGFQFDTEYNGGVLEKARLPEAKGLSTLPSGMIPPDSPLTSDLPSGVEVDFDLGIDEITKEAGQDVPLVDHSWLASNPVEDLEGMRSHEDVLQHFSEGRFEHPQANQLKTLQDSWASGSTTGLDILPNSQRQHQKYTNPYHEHQSQLPGDDYRMRVEMGQRKVAYGQSLNKVVAELSEGMSGAQAQKLARTLDSEYGLNGKVFIRAEHFPGLFNGRWDEVVNKRCASALYIISDMKDCAFDRFLGKKVLASVDQINWKYAYQTLMPRLETYGVKRASGGDPSSILKQAFIDVIEGRVEAPETPQTWFQVQADPTEGLSLTAAQEALENAEIDQTFVTSSEDIHESRMEAKLDRIASQLVREGFLEREQVEAVTSQVSKSASEKIDRLYALSSMPKQASKYAGQGEGAKFHTPTKSKIEENFRSRSEINFEQRLAKAKAKMAQLVSTGLISESESKGLLNSAGAQPEMAIAQAFSKAATNSLNETGLYEGVGNNISFMPYKTAKIATNFKTRNEVSFAQRVAKAQENIGKLIKAGLVSVEEAEQAASAAKTPEEKVLRIYEKAASKGYERREYQGQIDNSEARLSTEDLTRIQNAFFKKASHQSQKDYEAQVGRELTRILKAGLLSEERMNQLISKHSTLDARLHAIYREASKIDPMKSTGQTAHYGVKKEASISEHQKKVAYTNDWKVASSKVEGLLKGGLISQAQYDSLSGIKSPKDYMEKAFKLASTPQEVLEYQGDETAHVLGQKKSSERLASEMKVGSWVRQKMTEGSAGQELDALLAGRFSQGALQSHAELIHSLRTAHEGVSGYAYVDAEAYMTTGTEGCEKGALIHRANQIPTLLKTAKCGSCVFNSGGSCQKYAKTIVASTEEIIEDKTAYQREMIRLANASDSEQTASLFVNNYDADEFGLSQEKNVSLDDTPSHEDLGDVLFGGFEV